MASHGSIALGILVHPCLFLTILGDPVPRNASLGRVLAFEKDDRRIGIVRYLACLARDSSLAKNGLRDKLGKVGRGGVCSYGI